MLCTDVKEGKARVFRVEVGGMKGLSGKTNISGKMISDLTVSDSSTVNHRYSKVSMSVNKTKQNHQTPPTITTKKSHLLNEIINVSFPLFSFHE